MSFITLFHQAQLVEQSSTNPRVQGQWFGYMLGSPWTRHRNPVVAPTTSPRSSVKYVSIIINNAAKSLQKKTTRTPAKPKTVENKMGVCNICVFHCIYLRKVPAPHIFHQTGHFPPLHFRLLVTCRMSFMHLCITQSHLISQFYIFL